MDEDVMQKIIRIAADSFDLEIKKINPATTIKELLCHFDEDKEERYSLDGEGYVCFSCVVDSELDIKLPSVVWEKSETIKDIYNAVKRYRVTKMMNESFNTIRKLVLDHVKAILIERGSKLNAKDITEESKISVDLELDDELDDVEIIMAIEKKFGIELSDDEAGKIMSDDPVVGKIVDFVIKEIMDQLIETLKTLSLQEVESTIG
jgi:acyl carrier protein